MTFTAPIVIVGSGQAGVTLARELRKRDQDKPITLICDDAGGFYSKPMLSNAFAKDMPLEKLQIQDADTLAAKINMSVIHHTQVISIDSKAKTLTTSNQDLPTLSYDALILATGARPIKPPMPGIENTVSINHLQDYKALRSQLDEKKSHVTIIGGGLVGCELANDLTLGGHTITLIEKEDQLLSRLASKAIAAQLQQALEGIGVNIKTQCQVKEINDEERCTILVESPEAKPYTIEADTVISALGLAPNTDLAAQTGLTISHGIVTNRLLQTSDNNIYALGDCLELTKNLPYILPIMEGAKALAATLCGEPTQVRYPAMPVAVKTTSYPMVVCAPFVDDTTQEQTLTEAGGKTLYFQGPQLVGFCLAGDAVKERQTLASQCLGIFAQLES